MKKSPFLAFILAFIPGCGHLYIGRKGRGVVYPILFFGSIFLALAFGFIIGGNPVFIFIALGGLIWGINMLDIIITLIARSQVTSSTVPQHKVNEGDNKQFLSSDLDDNNQQERFYTILLSFIPGVGHFHMGLNQRGLTLLAGFFGIITMVFFVSVLTSSVFLIFLLALPIIWIYSLFDVIQLLNKKQAGEPLQDKTIMDDFNNLREEGKKSKMLATLLSIFPGAGHMYLGLQKRGLQLMAGFLLSIYILDVLRLSLFLFLIPIIWFYSFFDALQRVNRVDQAELEDVPVIRYLINHQKWLGVGLILLGCFYLFDTIMLPTLSYYFQSTFQLDIRYYYNQYFQISLVSLLFIFGGFKLIIGSKKSKEESK
ncbi:DUF6677 family protein [Aquibacillus rhizosphaerae]|uniref:DUF6677 domain-containing protein n=1 Tax=Aquibacillus rhizosphaerae TaxID=3051431 RepID=A0ABT7L8T9_9BACI|nr:DUF6677 family protein [Aquibacillus sp. LR5S19]MDL4842273.1 hypothetical protein [Aquibacillus sp. LR5S19]